MIVWRITAHPALDGAGGLYASARWHTKGHRIIYTAMSPTGALVEVLAGLDLDAAEIPDTYRLLGIELPDAWPCDEVGNLPDDWRMNVEHTRAIGDRWLTGDGSKLLVVPSTLIAHTRNVLVAADRIGSDDLKPVHDEPFQFDSRLLSAGQAAH